LPRRVRRQPLPALFIHRHGQSTFAARLAGRLPSLVQPESHAVSSPPCGTLCAVAASDSFAGVVSGLCVKPDSASTPMRVLMPKRHWLPLLVCRI